ncbi:MAG: tRNA (cytidine(34)-2'-O)-methyltransferase [SAR324 cluster bacterium]|nr:tRNA (cytidine(34)-2'-O)-methyltransferase [SAR324 cluster bacterium]
MNYLSSPNLNIVLVEPQIPPNTGNIARLCAAAECHLILLGELGFELSDKYLKRAGLDYWEFVSWEHIPSSESFIESLPSEHFHLLTTHTHTPYTRCAPKKSDYYFFGKETAGLPKHWLSKYKDRCYTIPMWNPNIRSLNLSSAAAIVVYDALHHILQF